MKLKLEPNLCYLAGLTSSSSEKNNAIGIVTSINAIEERFVKIAIGLGVEPTKIAVEEIPTGRHAYFFHSMIARMLKRISERSSRLFRMRNELAASYIAGMFDGSGHIDRNSVAIRKLSVSDRLVLEQAGIHVVNGRIMNISALIAVVGNRSIVAERLARLANAKADA